MSWDFVKFVCGEEGADILASTGTIPAIMTDDIANMVASIEDSRQMKAAKRLFRLQICI